MTPQRPLAELHCSLIKARHDYYTASSKLQGVGQDLYAVRSSCCANLQFKTLGALVPIGISNESLGSIDTLMNDPIFVKSTPRFAVAKLSSMLGFVVLGYLCMRLTSSSQSSRWNANSLRLSDVVSIGSSMLQNILVVVSAAKGSRLVPQFQRRAQRLRLARSKRGREVHQGGLKGEALPCNWSP